MTDIHDLREETRAAFHDLGATSVDILAEHMKPFALKALSLDAVDDAGGVGAYRSMLAHLVAQCARAGVRSPSGLLAHNLRDSKALEELWRAKQRPKPVQATSRSQERREALTGWLKDLDLLERLESGSTPFGGLVAFECEDVYGGRYTLGPDGVRARAEDARRGLKSLGVSEEGARSEVGLYQGLREKL